MVPSHIAKEDTILPLGVFDDTILYRSVIIKTLLLFDQLLDVNKLQSSLELLVAQPGWRKIGARLRRNKENGGLEYHIPRTFNQERPGVRCRCIQRLKQSIPPQLRHSRTGSHPSILENSIDFHEFCCLPGLPVCLHDYLQGDEPQLSATFVQFHDATLICLTWPHTLFDAVGQGELVRAWTMMIQGRFTEISAPLECDPARSSALDALGDNAVGTYEFHGFQLSPLGLILYFVKMLIKRLISKQQRRTIVVPAQFIQRLHKEALEHLPGEAHQNNEVFLSHGDVLCAWWSHISASHLQNNGEKMVQVMNFLDWRPSLRAAKVITNNPYIANAIGVTSAFVSSKDMFSNHLGWLAWRIRRGIIKSRTREQIETFAALWKKSPLMLPPLFGNHSMLLIPCTNWSKTKLFHADFSAATACATAGLTSAKTTNPVYIQGCFKTDMSNLLVIFGQDCCGNYWLSHSANEQQWSRIRRAMRRYRT